MRSSIMGENLAVDLPWNSAVKKRKLIHDESSSAKNACVFGVYGIPYIFKYKYTISEHLTKVIQTLASVKYHF